jgi:MoxR-like ATPase
MVATMNDDSSTFDLPEYIHSRLQPQILIDFPEREEELAILRENLPFAEDKVLDYIVEFLQMAHASEERYTVRDGINIGRYAMKLMMEPAVAGGANEALAFSIRHTLGEEALRYARRS